MSKPTLIFVSLLLFPAFLLSQKNDLEDTTRELSVKFMGWGCDCPNWCEEKNYDYFFEHRDTSVSTQKLIEKYCFNLTPSSSEVEIDWDSFYSSSPPKTIVLKGAFYRELQDWPGDDRTIRCRVFRYTSYHFIEE
ncbi:hypothetical protein [Parvicella tangerina]|uniref:Uncharacterized protein n=1 Tax=Parvicella tangerina TaxID=2829795 RepID=A0A916NIP0_9FLAO|nr:hypothetical protein [Parvicella tangerina]CAG5084439.1 hypothetical protein CRYO30217_02465 [Parvicella tangerina]